MESQDLAQMILDSDGLMLNYEQRRFWNGRIDPGYLQSIFSWHHLNQLLSTHRITNDRLRLSRVNDHLSPNKLAFRQARDQFGRSTDCLSINVLHRLMHLGVTGVLEATNELIPQIEALTTDIRTRFDARSSANAYFSFGSTSGFGAHNDDHDVIVIQFQGRKCWHFFRTATSAEKATVQDLGAPTTHDRGHTILLEEGEVMFVPKGTWHDVVALDEPSLHVTVSIVYPTVADFIGWLLKQHKFGLPFRDISMGRDDLGALASACSDFINKTTSREVLLEFLKTYYTRYAASRFAPAFPTLNRVSPADCYKRLPYAISILDKKEADVINISALGQRHAISEAEYRILNELSHKYSSSLSDILVSVGGCISNLDTATSALERLLDIGLISKVRGEQREDR